MSKLEELIQQYCPDGVEYMKLGGFATQWYRGAGIKKDEIGQEGIPCIRYGEIHTIYKIWFDKCVSHTDETKQPSKKYADYGDILFAITSEDIPFIGNSVAYMGKERIMVGGDIVVMKHTQNPKYISYVLSTVDAVSQKGKGKVKSKVVHTNVPSLKEIVIPVPPLPVQEEIVRILDTFTELQAELQAELQKRKQQYNYYLDNLLSFNDISRGGQAEVRWMILREACEFVKDGTHGSYKNVDNGYPLLSAKDINNGVLTIPTNSRKISKIDFDDIYKNYKIKSGDVLITIVGSVGRTAIVRDFIDVAFQRSVGILRPNNKVTSSFLFYILQTTQQQKQLMSKISKSAQGGVYLGELNKIVIPIPPLEEQQRIVSILDRFDRITNDLTAGLPAEIEKRRQQYEYYRDKLLTFKRKGA